MRKVPHNKVLNSIMKSNIKKYGELNFSEAVKEMKYIEQQAKIYKKRRETKWKF